MPVRTTTTIIRHLLTSAHRSPKPLPSLAHPSLHHRPFSSPKTDPLTPTRSRTPLESQFESWIHTLKPGFSTTQVDLALRAQPDPDLALDIFRWTSNQRHYKHNHRTYNTMLTILAESGRYKQAETLVEEILAGACDTSLTLYNATLRFCCGRKFLFNRAFDVYGKMLRSQDCKPDLETFTLLLATLLKRFDKLHVCYVYLRAVRSLRKQMKSLGVIPDTFVLNMIVKAFSKCREVDEAVRVFREMGLYGCEPDSYTYGYIVKGMCEKGRIEQGFGLYDEMKVKGLVPSGSTFMVLICSLALERRLEDAVGVAFDMLGCSLSPDLLTYKTILEGMCREGKGDEATELLEEFKKRDGSMGTKSYNTLLNELHYFVSEEKCSD